MWDIKSTIVDADAELARRIGADRKERGWSLADLADRSGVSRSMLSKIERREASPTAAVLLRIAGALGITLAELLTPQASGTHRKQSRADQPTWIDPATRYLRRQVYLSQGMPLELVEVELPARASVAAPASSYTLIRQVLWVLDGTVTVIEGAERTELEAGDRLEFGPPSDVTFRNDSDAACRYLVAVVRT